MAKVSSRIFSSRLAVAVAPSMTRNLRGAAREATLTRALFFRDAAKTRLRLLEKCLLILDANVVMSEFERDLPANAGHRAVLEHDPPVDIPQIASRRLPGSSRRLPEDLSGWDETPLGKLCEREDAMGVIAKPSAVCGAVRVHERRDARTVHGPKGR